MDESLNSLTSLSDVNGLSMKIQRADSQFSDQIKCLNQILAFQLGGTELVTLNCLQLCVHCSLSVCDELATFPGFTLSSPTESRNGLQSPVTLYALGQAVIDIGWMDVRGFASFFSLVWTQK